MLIRIIQFLLQVLAALTHRLRCWHRHRQKDHPPRTARKLRNTFILNLRPLSKGSVLGKIGKVLSKFTSSKDSKQPTASATGKSPTSSTSSPGKSTSKETVLSLLQARYWPMDEETTTEIHAEFPRIKKEYCKQVRDTLGYQKKMVVHERAADKLLKRLARRKKVTVSKLVVQEVDNIIPDDVTLQTFSSKTLFPKLFKRVLVSTLFSSKGSSAVYFHRRP